MCVYKYIGRHYQLFTFNNAETFSTVSTAVPIRNDSCAPPITITRMRHFRSQAAALASRCADVD